jgi:uncharacterized protein
MWKETTRQERNLKIYREELDAFLPDAILDFHVHVFNAETIRNGESFSCSGHPIHSYALDELAADLGDLYPGRKTLSVCFGFPEVVYDRAENNRYLAESCDRKRFFPLRLFDPTGDTADSLRSELSGKQFLGLKPYPDYVRKANINDVEIHEMLPSWAMEIVNDLGMIVMLHIPRSARLADPLNQRQIVELAQLYPKAKIVLAHIGRAYFLKNVIGNLDALKPYSNLYFDLAMVNHWEVMEYLFREIPAHRILYGTDVPLAIAPGKSVEINDQYTYVTPVPWPLSISDDHQKIRFTSFLYEELRAVKKAAQRLNLGREFMEGLFCQNGMRLLRDLV